MAVQIREAVATDATAISQLSSQLGYEISVVAAQTCLQLMAGHADHRVWIALKDNSIVGWIHGFKALRLESAPFVEVGGLVIDRDYRRKGIGKQLIERVKEWCIQCNLHSIRVRCNTKRPESHRFYFGCGFTESKEQKVFTLPVQQ